MINDPFAHVRRLTYRVVAALASLAIVAVSSGEAQASIQDLQLSTEKAPDIFSAFTDVTYDHATRHFYAFGYAITLDDGGGAKDISGGNDGVLDFGEFILDLTIGADDDPTSVTGTLTIEGDVVDLGYTSSDSLLTANIIAIGSPGGDDLEFLFEVTGGEAAALYGGMNYRLGIKLYETGFPGQFTRSFDNNWGMPGFGMAYSDTARMVPEPASLLSWTVLLGVAGAYRRARRKSRKDGAGQ